MNAKIKSIEKILGVKLDGVWDDKDQTALDKLVQPKKKVAPMMPAPEAMANPADVGQVGAEAPPTYVG